MLPDYLDIYKKTFKNETYSIDHHIQYDFVLDEIKKIFNNTTEFTY